MIVIVNNGGANINSLLVALQRLNAEVTLTQQAAVIKRASHIILPGVGAAATAMQLLTNYGLVTPLRTLTQPVLGICLGMQLLYECSDEGDIACLGIISGSVKKLKNSPEITVPHMGWNTLEIISENKLCKDIKNDDYCYFVHSYAAAIANETCAVSKHGEKFSAIVQKNNFYGTQFHPEKSGKVGLQILKNFLEISA